MKIQTLLIVCFVTLLITSCKWGINRESVVGKWKIVSVDVEVGKEIDTNTLEHKANVNRIKKSLLEEIFVLNADSSYSIIEHKTKAEYTGTWRFDDLIKSIDFFQTGNNEPSFIWNVKSVNNKQMKIKVKFKLERGSSVSIFAKLNKQNNEK